MKIYQVAPQEEEPDYPSTAYNPAVLPWQHFEHNGYHFWAAADFVVTLAQCIDALFPASGRDRWRAEQATLVLDTMHPMFANADAVAISNAVDAIEDMEDVKAYLKALSAHTALCVNLGLQIVPEFLPPDWDDFV